MKHKTQADSNYRPHSCTPAGDISVAAVFLTLGSGAESSAMVLKDALALIRAPWFGSHSRSRPICQIKDSCWKLGVLGRAIICFPCSRAAPQASAVYCAPRQGTVIPSLWPTAGLSLGPAGNGRGRGVCWLEGDFCTFKWATAFCGSWPAPKSCSAESLPHQAACPVERDALEEQVPQFGMSRLDLVWAVTTSTPKQQTSRPYHVAAPCDT